MKKRAPVILLSISILLTIIGVFSGGPGDVFKKAINLCLSCIGIG